MIARPVSAHGVHHGGADVAHMVAGACGRHRRAERFACHLHDVRGLGADLPHREGERGVGAPAPLLHAHVDGHDVPPPSGCAARESRGPPPR